MRVRRILERNRYTDVSLLRLLDDYLEGAGDSLGGAYSFTQGAPMTFISLNNLDNTRNEHYGVAGTHTDT